MPLPIQRFCHEEEVFGLLNTIPARRIDKGFYFELSAFRSDITCCFFLVASYDILGVERGGDIYVLMPRPTVNGIVH